MKVLYSIGDSVVWGAELENKETERFSHYVAKEIDAIDCNNASAGVSNDYLFRHTIRDIIHWKNTGKVWSEETSWVECSEFILCMGITSPTRFEWWDGKKYQQERLWKGYDKWGKNDEDRNTLDFHVLNQTEHIPSYIRTLQGIHSVKNLCENLGINYIIFNTFFKWNLDEIEEPNDRIDTWGRLPHQLGIKEYWNDLPVEFKLESMYDYFKKQKGGLLPRNHPTHESHKIWSKRLVELYNKNKYEDEF